MVSTNKRLHQQKVVYTICTCLSNLVYGLILAHTDSALLELQRITSVTLEEAALYMTMVGAGFLVGSILCGAVFNRIDKFLSQAFILLLAAIVVAIIPWCSSHVAMATAHAIVGGLLGFIDTIAIAEVLAVWGTDGRSFMQALSLGYSVGGVISPILVATFTTPSGHVPVSFYETIDKLPNTTTPMTNFPQIVGSNSNSNGIGYNTLNFTEDHQQIILPDDSTSRIYIAYIITACICAVLGMPFFLMFFTFSRDIYSKSSHLEMAASTDDSLCWKIAVLSNTGVLVGVYVAVSDTVAGFLVAFCVTQMNWTIKSGSLLLSFMEGCFCLGLILSIFWVRYIKPKNVLGIFLPLVSVMFFILTWCGLNNSDYGIWISIGLLGLLMSAIFPTLFTWTEDEYFPVTGKIVSLINIAESIGAITSPIVIGILMDRYSPMWFAYILLAASWMMLLLFIIGMILSRQSRPCKVEEM